MPENQILIIALSNHPVLGPLLIPYFARTVSPEVISVEEQATHAEMKRGCLIWRNGQSRSHRVTRKRN